MELADEIYKLTKKFPDEERYSLVSQMRRSAISIPSNIAEGYRRNSKGSYIQFLLVAYGSGGELETQIEICKRNLNLNQNEYEKAENLLEEVMKMLNSLISKLRTTAYDLRAENGFTMIELLITIFLFVTLISIVSGVFVRSLRVQRATVALIAANSNASLALEQIAREIRTGYDFSESSGGLNFTNANGDDVVYRLNGTSESLERSRDGGSNFKTITADNVKIKNFVHRLFKGSPPDPYPSRVTISLAVAAAGSSLVNPVVNLQTTVSARTLGK